MQSRIFSGNLEHFLNIYNNLTLFTTSSDNLEHVQITYNIFKQYFQTADTFLGN